MVYSNKYIALIKQSYQFGDFRIVPIRFEDRYLIMKWRNEQMYHLRQNLILTRKQQDIYFNDVIAQLFYQKQPKQLLFSYLKNNQCIGYGGLVHIDWEEKKAELSFIMQTDLEKKEFNLHWHTFIKMIEKLAFYDLNFSSIYTYAYNLRLYLYSMLEKAGFKKIKKFSNKVIIEGKAIDVIIHERINPVHTIEIHPATVDDVDLVYNWFNDDLVRKHSYQSAKILLEEHQKWFQQKVKDKFSMILIVKIKNIPIGLIRFDFQRNFSVIGVSIDKNFRGKGLSIPLLIAGANYYFKKYSNPIKAFIKKSNIISVKAFKGAGFHYYKDEMVKGVDSYVYIKNANK